MIQTEEMLFATALNGGDDDDRVWAAVVELQKRGTPTVFARAVQSLSAQSELERTRGADVLAQLGVGGTWVERRDGPPPFRTPSVDALLTLLRGETSPRVLNSAGVALGHLKDPRAVEALIPFSRSTTR